MFLQTAISRKHISWTSRRNISSVFDQACGHNTWSRISFLSGCWANNFCCYFEANWK